MGMKKQLEKLSLVKLFGFHVFFFGSFDELHRFQMKMVVLSIPLLGRSR